MFTSLYLLFKFHEARAMFMPYIILSLRVAVINKHPFTDLKVNINLKEDITIVRVSLFYFFFFPGLTDFSLFLFSCPHPLYQEIGSLMQKKSKSDRCAQETNSGFDYLSSFQKLIGAELFFPSRKGMLTAPTYTVTRK